MRKGRPFHRDCGSPLAAPRCAPMRGPAAAIPAILAVAVVVAIVAVPVVPVGSIRVIAIILVRVACVIPIVPVRAIGVVLVIAVGIVAVVPVVAVVAVIVTVVSPMPGSDIVVVLLICNCGSSRCNDTWQLILLRKKQDGCRGSNADRRIPLARFACLRRDRKNDGSGAHG